MTHLIADVALPVLWPWRAGRWCDFGALVAEAIVFCFITTGGARLWSRVLAVVTANILSLVVGVFVAFVLWPPGWHLLHFAAYFLMAWALSVGIEYGVYLCVPPWRRLPHLFRAVILSNLASYAIIFGALEILDYLK